MSEVPSSDSAAVTPEQEQEPTSLTATAPAVRKIEILLKPVGDAPIMKHRKFNLEETKTVAWVSNWVRQYLKLGAEDSLFFYINQAFAPPLDAIMRNLYDCYGAENRLVLHYSRAQAWG